MKSNTSLTLAFAVSAVATLGALAQVTVYQVGSGANKFYSSTSEFGDEAVLPTNPGGSWVISNITIPYYSTYDAPNSLTLRLYDNTGAAGSPGTLLYDSGFLNISKGANNTGSTLSIDFPNIAGNAIPNTLTYTVSFAGQGGANVAGLIVPNAAPSVGSSKNDFWQKDAGVWTLHKVGGGDLSNFQVSITAVPEPGPMALAGAGAVAWLGFMAFRRFQSR
jgi:hypothetical protein